MSDELEKLAATIAARRHGDAEQSYVSSLHNKGLNKILEKVGEEATEVILAAKDVESGGDPAALIGEVADLWFHSIVMLSHLDLDITAVQECLGQRFGVSGLQEKAARNDQNK